MSSIQQHPHGARMAESTLRRIQPLIVDENIADNFVNFEREWKVYQIAALSEKDKKVQAYTLLNLAGPDAILKSENSKVVAVIHNSLNQCCLKSESYVSCWRSG